MGRKKKTKNEYMNKVAEKGVATQFKISKIGSVQDMDDRTYMYLLIIGQLMFDRRHRIAEKLAGDLCVSTVALAASDALIRIIRKSREAHTDFTSCIGQKSNQIRKKSSKEPVSVCAEGSDKERPSLDDDVDLEMELSINKAADCNNEDIIDDALDFKSDQNVLEEKSTSQCDELPVDNFIAELPNLPRETADGKIIMVYVPQEKFPCSQPNCKQTFLTKENLDYHLVCSRIHNPQFTKDWGCRYCGKEFSGMSHVKTHEKMKHEEHDKEVCYECGKQFDTLEKMKRHIDVHHLQKKYKCKHESCPMEFSSDSGAKYHYKRVHLNEQIPCTIEGCPRRFDRKCDLRRHLEKSHRDGQLGAVSKRTRKQVNANQSQPIQPALLPQQHQLQQLQPQPQHHQEPPQPPQQHQPTVVEVVEQTRELQHSIMPAQYQHQEGVAYTTMQTITQQMTIPPSAIPTSTVDPQQQLNQEQLQAIQSLQFLQQQHQQQPQHSTQFPAVSASSFHTNYMY